LKILNDEHVRYHLNNMAVSRSTIGAHLKKRLPFNDSFAELHVADGGDGGGSDAVGE
jgi:hypothetical protein